jgi:hypothetical protein
MGRPNQRPEPPAYEPPAYEPPINPRVKLIAQELAANPQTYAGLTAPQIAALLNAPVETPNPQPQGRVPRPTSAIELLTLAKPEEAIAIYNLGQGEFKRDIEAVIKSNDPQAIGAVFQMASAMLSPETQQAIGALLAQTIPDPTWTATLKTPSRAQQIGVGNASPAEVIQAQEVIAKG